MTDLALRALERRVATGEAQRGELVLAALRAGGLIHWAPTCKGPLPAVCGAPVGSVISDDMLALQRYTDDWAVPWPGITCPTCRAARAEPLTGAILRRLPVGTEIFHGSWRQGRKYQDPYRAVTTGRTREWKTRPAAWERNIRHGMGRNRESFRLSDWLYPNGLAPFPGSWGPWFLNAADAREWRDRELNNRPFGGPTTTE